jgi:hypothetical protein
MTDALNTIRRRSSIALAKEADAILERANCDTTTGAKQDRPYRRNKRAESKRLARHRRTRSKRLGKFGAASPVRTIPPNRESCDHQRAEDSGTHVAPVPGDDLSIPEFLRRPPPEAAQ